MDKRIKQFSGANMDIDLTSDEVDIDWKQSACPWNEAENTKEHKCAVKNTSICKYFCGIKYLDTVLCSFPYANTDVLSEKSANHNFRFTEKIFSASHENGKR